MDIQQNPSHLSCPSCMASNQHCSHVVLVGRLWVEATSKIQSHSDFKCKITPPQKKFSRVEKSFRNLLILGSPTQTWNDLDSLTRIPFPFCTPPNGSSTLSHPSDWPAIVLGWLGFRANPRWIAARFRQNAYVSPHRSAQVNDKPASSKRCQMVISGFEGGSKCHRGMSGDLLFEFFLFVKKSVIVKTAIGSRTYTCTIEQLKND